MNGKSIGNHRGAITFNRRGAHKDDLGADSIDLVELIMAFEDEYGITADYEEMDKRVKTVGDIIEYLKDQGADI